MEDKKIDILGSEWTVKLLPKTVDPILEDCDGYCDWTMRKIVVEDITGFGSSLGDLKAYHNKVLRHEIVHAFLFESGLYENSQEIDAWARNEEMVDWIARQGPKIYKAWEAAGALD